MDTLLQDVRYALRSLRRTPGFAMVAILTLALGIGASTAIFTVVNAVLLRPLPFDHPERLVMLWERPPSGEPHNVASPANFTAWKAQARSVTGLAATYQMKMNLTGGGEPEELRTGVATDNFFRTLGVKAARGRVFTPGESAGEGGAVVVLSHGLWVRRFGADPSVIGRTLLLNDQPLQVVGVLPASFSYLDARADIWAPTEFPAESRGRFLTVVGRLAPGATVERARAEMEAIAKRTEVEAPQFNTGWSVNPVPLHEESTGAVRPALMLMGAGVAFLLLIACANVANLLLGRSAGRRREVAVRFSLGATRGRVVRQMLVESLVMAAAAGVLGLALAWWGTGVMVRLLPDEVLPRLAEVHVDARVAAFAVACSVLTGVLFGIAPALSASAVRLVDALRDGGRGSTGGRARVRMRGALVATELAMAMVLLVGAALLGRSFARMVSVEPGFQPEGAVTVRFTLPRARYAEAPAQRQFYRALFNRTAQIPGVHAAGTIWYLPMSGEKSATNFVIDGRPKPAPGAEPDADIRIVGGEYFKAMGIALRRGRVFAETDREDGPDVFVINDELARTYFPGQDPVGKRIGYDWGRTVNGKPEFFRLMGTVVGVVGSVHENGLTAQAAPAIYRWYRQEPPTRSNLVVRTAGDPAAVVPALVAAVHAVDPQIAVADARTLEEVVGGTIARPRLSLTLFGFFAAMAMLLASIGIYGVIAFSVAQRRGELGVRMALGASRGDVTRLVVGQGMAMAAAGVGAGLVGALLLTRLMSSLLFGVRPTDPAALLGAAVFLGGVALLASWVPARRAARTDPMLALRAE
jgi:putative ABC transport system permease protein